MKRQYKWIIALFSTILGLILLFNVAGDLFVREVARDIEIEEEEIAVESRIDAGDRAPSWELENLEGENVDFVEFLGEPFVVTFWSTWNARSADQLKIFDDYLGGREDNAFEIIVINSQEDKSTVLNFTRRAGYNITTLLDETGQVGQEYGIRTLPVTYFIDAEGVIREKFSGVLNGVMLEEKIASLFAN